MRNCLFILIIGLIVFNSCIKNNDKPLDNSTRMDIEHNQILQIDRIKPLPTSLYEYTEHITKKVLDHDHRPNIADSKIVSYVDMSIQAIYTPLISYKKSSKNNSLVFFELDGLISNFEFIISEECLNGVTTRYLYKDIDGTVLLEFDVNNTDGQVLQMQANPNKNWFRRWKNCAEHTLNYMIDNPVDGLVCMAFGKYCAGTIAAMCAIAAAEGYFKEM